MLKDEPKYGLCRWSGGWGMWYGLGFTRCLVPDGARAQVKGIEVVAAGSLGEAAIHMIRSFGIEVHELPFDTVVASLSSRGIAFNWGEKDRTTPRIAWEMFQELSEEEKQRIGDEIAGTISNVVTASVLQTLDADLNTVEKRVSAVELLLKTTHDEMFLFTYPNVREAAQALLGLLTDSTDITNFLKKS